MLQQLQRIARSSRALPIPIEDVRSQFAELQSLISTAGSWIRRANEVSVSSEHLRAGLSILALRSVLDAQAGLCALSSPKRPSSSSKLITFEVTVDIQRDVHDCCAFCPQALVQLHRDGKRLHDNPMRLSEIVENMPRVEHQLEEVKQWLASVDTALGQENHQATVVPAGTGLGLTLVRLLIMNAPMQGLRQRATKRTPQC